jgi:hypothetical protein
MPIFIPNPYSVEVYSKAEVDSFLILKADKVPGAGHLNIAGLTGSEGNLLDLGVGIEDLFFGDYADGRIYDNSQEY